MIKLVPFHLDNPLQHQNGIVIRHNFETIEFGFPYFDALPIKLSVSQCLELLKFINLCLGLKTGKVYAFEITPSDREFEEIIVVRKTLGAGLHIHIAFSDINPVLVEMSEVLNFARNLKEILDIKLIESPKEELF